jgi:hypothetical protein
MTSLTAPQPRAATPTTEPTAVLAKRVSTRGKCSPSGGGMTVNAGQFAVDDDNDPWFPVTQDEAELEVLARRACRGCPVGASCLELTLRTEVRTPRDIHGIVAGLAPHERRALVQARIGRAA